MNPAPTQPPLSGQSKAGGSPASRTGPKARLLFICLGLALATFAVYWPVTGHEFINYDDPDYVTENLQVQAGLTWKGVLWAFRTGHAGNWHPLTWLSHMLDVQLFGLRPGWHHLTNVLFHIVNTLLLFGLLKRMTGALWRSAFVAALFALHPLHVESVAWVAERKDVLSAFFGLLTIWFYARYAASRSTLSPQRLSLNYSLALVCFALGLMSKPMLVTWPFLLLLLDWWPLRRLQFSTLSSRPSTLWPLLREKLPFLTLTLISSIVTFLIQTLAGAVGSLETVPIESRIFNVLVSYLRYLEKTIWPAKLAVLYPYSQDWPPYLVVLAIFLLAAVSGGVILTGRQRPYLVTGWLWYLGTLAPVIGIVQVGSHSIADRYSYLPLCGVFLMVTWGAYESVSHSRFGKAVMASASCLLVAGCIAGTTRQLTRWKDNETLFTHTIRVTSNNYLAHGNLAFYLADRGRIEEAISHYAEVLRIRPRDPDAHSQLGFLLAKQGSLDYATSHFEAALESKQDSKVHYNLANVLAEQGRIKEAIGHHAAAVRLKPDFVEARHNLGILLARTGRKDEAIAHYQAILKIKPDYLAVRNSLGALLAERGQSEAAAAEFLAVLRQKPEDADALYNLAMILKSEGKLAESATCLSRLLLVNPGDADTRQELGLMFAQLGKFDQAAEQFAHVLTLRPNAPDAHYNAALSLASQGQTSEAIAHYRDALRFRPEFPDALNNLAWILATHPEAKFRDGLGAVAMAEKACGLTEYRVPILIGTLGAAYAEAGRFEDAVKAAEKARALALAAGLTELAEKNQELIDLFRARRAYREPAKKVDSE